MAALHLDYVNTFYDARGKLRHSFRRKGFKRTTIKGRPGSPEFMARYHELLDKSGGPLSVADAGAGRVVAGSVDALILKYQKSDAFKKYLAKATQSMRLAILERFRECKTPSGRRYGDNRIATLPASAISDALKPLSPNAQRNWIKTLRGLMVFAIDQKECSVNPTTGIKPAKPAKSKGHLTWGQDQIAQYREHHKLGTVPRLALELMLNIAARRHDAHLIGKPHLKDGKLTWCPHKTLRTTGKSLTVRVLPELQAALDAMPKSDALAFLTVGSGRPFASPAAFGNAFADWCRAACLKPVTCEDGKVRSYRAHGLRKAACVALAHAGCTGPEIMAVSGHATLAQVQIYIDEADQQRMAETAMDKRTASR
jgi:integrase/recombinase XerD